jgi:hypothetical protein
MPVEKKMLLRKSSNHDDVIMDVEDDLNTILNQGAAREYRNLAAGILFLLVAREIVRTLFQRRQDRSN